LYRYGFIKLGLLHRTIAHRTPWEDNRCGHSRPRSRRIPPPADNGPRRCRQIICGMPPSQPQLKSAAAAAVIYVARRIFLLSFHIYHGSPTLGTIQYATGPVAVRFSMKLCLRFQIDQSTRLSTLRVFQGLWQQSVVLLPVSGRVVRGWIEEHVSTTNAC